MNQRQLAIALGIDEAAVSRDIRRGMPSTSVEAAARWRDIHVRPYSRSVNTRVPRVAFEGADEELARLGVVDGRTALRAANELAAAAARLLGEGRFGDLAAPLRCALQAVPAPLRAQVAMRGPVWLELTKDVRALFEPGTIADGAAAQAAAPMEAAQRPPADHQSIGDFWYSVAAGEWAVDGSQIG
jgi:hypothetical protein